MGGLKELIREKATSGRNARTRVIEVEMDGQPQKVGVKQASLYVRKKILSITQDKGNDPAALTQAKLQIVIECMVDPESGERIWNDRDRDILAEQPAGGWVDQVADEALTLFWGPSTKKCDKCSNPIQAGIKFCPHCGAELPNALEVAEGN